MNDTRGQQATGSAAEAAGSGGSRIRQRQRQRLIDACISALHIYGPSRTTVEKVVSLADLSPGIVRFYFESKAAMLVASLEYLAGEFEDRVMLPVARLKDTPAARTRRATRRRFRAASTGRMPQTVAGSSCTPASTLAVCAARSSVAVVATDAISARRSRGSSWVSDSITSMRLVGIRREKMVSSSRLPLTTTASQPRT